MTLLNAYRDNAFLQEDQVQPLVAEIRRRYKDDAQIPYHNYKHALDVAQMTHFLIRGIDDEQLPRRTKFFMIFAALCHDMQHFGYGSTDIETHETGSPFKAARATLKTGLDPLLQRSHMEFFHIHHAFTVMDNNFRLKREAMDTAKDIVKHVILATDHQNRDPYKNIIRATNDDSVPTDNLPRQALLFIKVTTCL